jgi:hypothetical protein
MERREPSAAARRKLFAEWVELLSTAETNIVDLDLVSRVPQELLDAVSGAAASSEARGQVGTLSRLVRPIGAPVDRSTRTRRRDKCGVAGTVGIVTDPLAPPRIATAQGQQRRAGGARAPARTLLRECRSRIRQKCRSSEPPMGFSTHRVETARPSWDSHPRPRSDSAAPSAASRAASPPAAPVLPEAGPRTRSTQQRVRGRREDYTRSTTPSPPPHAAIRVQRRTSTGRLRVG